MALADATWPQNRSDWRARYIEKFRKSKSWLSVTLTKPTDTRASSAWTSRGRSSWRNRKGGGPIVLWGRTRPALHASTSTWRKAARSGLREKWRNWRRTTKRGMSLAGRKRKRKSRRKTTYACEASLKTRRKLTASKRVCRSTTWRRCVRSFGRTRRTQCSTASVLSNVIRSYDRW